MKALYHAIADRINGQPVYTLTLVQVSIALGVSFGLHWTPEQIGAVTAFTAGLLGWITNRKVTAA